MNIIAFKTWLLNNNENTKVACDIISRLKKLDNALISCCQSTNIEREYIKDKCAFLLQIFRKKGIPADYHNLSLQGLPYGKYTLSTYKLALIKYLNFKNSLK